jgi:competence protein ComGC
MVTLIEMVIVLILVSININTISLHLFKFELEELERKVNKLADEIHFMKEEVKRK